MQTQLDRNQVTDWVNTAQPNDLIAVGKQALARIATFPPEQRDQFTREINNDRTVTKLFRTDA